MEPTEGLEKLLDDDWVDTHHFSPGTAILYISTNLFEYNSLLLYSLLS